jgi:hypothetical protein
MSSHFEGRVENEFQSTDDQLSTGPKSVYGPLIHEDSIRLLNIEPGAFEDPIHCSLEYTVLSENPQYYALSYTWGPVSPTFNIFVDGQEFEIRENLHSALLHFRFPTSSLTLWVDAICLNQDDVQERNHQVKEMGRVYENAAATFVWLGEPLEDDKMALDLFQGIEKAAKAPSRTSFLQNIIDQLTQPRIAYSVFRILSKTWFKRAWVQQEFALSSRASFACGSLLFSSTTIKDVIDAIELDSERKIDARLWNAMLGAKVIVNRELLPSAEPRNPLVWLLYWTFGRLEATDPRDRIYSLLGLMPDRDKARSLVDYDLTVEEVFTRSMSDCLLFEDNKNTALCLLSLVGAFSLGQYRASLPSWVPDFSSSSRLCVFMQGTETFSASGNTNASIRVNNKTAFIEGAVVDSIISIASCPHPLHTQVPQVEVREWLQLCRVFAESEGTFYLTHSFCDIWWRLLVCDLHYAPGNGYRSAAEGYKEFYLCDRFASHLYDSEDEHEDIEGKYEDSQNIGRSEPWYSAEYREMEAVFTNTFDVHTYGWNLCATNKGFLGWVNRNVEEGDKVVLLAGATAPFIMREAQDGSYRLLGAAYIHGIMYGEALNWEGVEWKTLEIR